MSFAGSGGPPPKMAREQGLSRGGQKPFGFRFYEKLANGKNKTIQMISVDKGEKDCPILILDEALPGGDEWQPSVYLHERFRYNGTWDNYAVVPKRPEGNLLDIALQEPFKMMPWSKPEDEARVGTPVPKRPKWRWVVTALKLKPYTIRSGKNKGKVIPYTRGLILAGEDQYKELLTYRKAFKGLRGRLFKVSRGEGTFAPRIGDEWNPDEHWSDEKMLEHFVDAASEYGLSVEDYCRPVDYEKILRLPSDAEIAEMAKWVAGERGIDLSTGQASTDANPVASAVSDSGADEESEEDVPF
jgi:hypothetical protein